MTPTVVVFFEKISKRDKPLASQRKREREGEARRGANYQYQE